MRRLSTLLMTVLPCAAPLLSALLAACGAQPKHAGQRFLTDRPHGHERSGTLLPLPEEDDAFHFVVFGDRTGGPKEGITVLEQAVADTNLLDPDLVMTVGDLVQGYNTTEPWMEQVAEYKGVMQQLRMPWFPVAGNHDVYWRGNGKPTGEHEAHYEAQFGPLWYAFTHKDCLFVCLYTDEGDPATGRKDFNDPACQAFSDEQLRWLKDTLHKGRSARHVFVFMHHPRWIKRGYPGSNWEEVHAELVAAGNVTAVFAGHIHRMRYDGNQDGIDYYTLAAVGAHLEFELPEAGYLHEVHVVSVRDGGITMSTLPVGTVMDPKLITGQVSEDTDRLMETLQPQDIHGLELQADGSALGDLAFTLHNRARRPIEVTAQLTGDDAWSFTDHQHLKLLPDEQARLVFGVRRRADLDMPLTMPQVVLDCDYLGDGLRFSLPTREFTADLPPPQELTPTRPLDDGALRLDGNDACIAIPSEALALPQGPFTVECWVYPEELTGRRGLLCKTENSEFGVFCSDGVVDFMVHLDGAYRSAASSRPVLQTGRWQHVAGVFDGLQVRTYVDGQLVSSREASGHRKTNSLRFHIGADPNARGRATSHVQGLVDEIRVSDVARYEGGAFTPSRRHTADEHTLLLLHCDGDAGPWLVDDSPRRLHPKRQQGASCEPRPVAADR
jgi:hypothetical protein